MLLLFMCDIVRMKLKVPAKGGVRIFMSDALDSYSKTYTEKAKQVHFKLIG